MTYSPAKIVFLMVAASVCAAFLFEIFRGAIVLDAKDFLPLATMVFAFYFTAKTSSPTDELGGK